MTAINVPNRVSVFGESRFSAAASTAATGPPPAAALPGRTATAGGTERGSGGITEPKPRGRNNKRGGRFWVIFLSTAVVLLGLAGIVTFFGGVSGREFSPTHFELRQFSYHEVPLLRLQITPIRRVTTSSPLCTYLVTSGLIRRPTGVPAVWHLVELDRSFQPADSADARLLTEFLQFSGFRGKSATASLRTWVPTAGNDYWHQWTLDHPEAAAVFWPQIQKLAERELYLLIPEAFRIATRSTTADELDEQLERYLVREYGELIREMQEAGRDELADALREEAAADFPNETF